MTTQEDGHTRMQEKMYIQVTESLNLSCVAFEGNKGGVLGNYSSLDKWPLLQSYWNKVFVFLPLYFSFIEIVKA